MTDHAELREKVARLADAVVLRVNEYDDRTSPDDWPEALLITSEELHSELIEFATAILALSAAPGRVEGWLPIETAPFDPEWSVLGWEPGMDAAMEMAWRSDMKRWLTRGGGEVQPTHWQPLPSPPEPSFSSFEEVKLSGVLDGGGE